ncbi:MAG: undecaprenyl diphosphate synthase family protein [Candidatus Nanohaloarchaea archaeon]
MHLGVIPDGNRRYAKEEGIENRKAYEKAKEVIKDIGKKLKDQDIEEATFYLLSEKNLRRDEEELEELFSLLDEYIEEVAERYNQEGFVLNWATTKPGALPERLREKLRGLEEKFDEGEKRVNLLISYDGKKDILQASEKLSNNGGNFSREDLKEYLQVGSDIDYVIRTGNNPHRESLSGFPLWNASYAEYYHIKKHFPAVTVGDVKEALQHFRRLRRKKGK